MPPRNGLASKLALLTKGTVTDPRKALRVFTWNIGSLSVRHNVVTNLLVSHAPHVVCLQEAHIRSHELRAFYCRLRTLGYTALHDLEKGALHCAARASWSST